MKMPRTLSGAGVACARDEIASGDLLPPGGAATTKCPARLSALGFCICPHPRTSSLLLPNAKPLSKAEGHIVVRGMRFELTRPFERYHLKVVRLPISPPTHAGAAKVSFLAGIFKRAGLFFQNDAEGGAFSEVGLADEELAFVILLDDAFGEA